MRAMAITFSIYSGKICVPIYFIDDCPRITELRISTKEVLFRDRTDEASNLPIVKL